MIPSGTHVIQGHWSPIYSQQVVAFLPLMRSRGVRQTVILTDAAAVARNVLDVAFEPLAQIFHPLTNVSLEEGDVLTTECTFTNPTATDVPTGKPRTTYFF